MLALLLLLQVAQDPLAQRADTAVPVHDALHYDITLIVPDSGGRITGQVETAWRITGAGPLAIDLDSVLVVKWLRTPGRDRAVGPWRREAGRIVLPQRLAVGDTLVTRIRYTGVPRAGLIFSKDASGQRVVFADNWPDQARGWFPSHDYPGDKATAAFHIEAPAGQLVRANGLLTRVDTLASGRTVWHYRIREPIPTYTMVVGVARFAVTPLGQAGCPVHCVPQSAWTFPADSVWAVGGPFSRVGEMVDLFTRRFGAFPYEELAHVQAVTRYGGVENAGAIWYDHKAVANHTLSERTVAHETAHQWFGDGVTEGDWHHLWLSEGFATYLAALWAEQAGGDSALAAAMARSAGTVFQSEDTERPILDFQATDLMGLLNSNNYPKGSWVLHSLRGLVGDSVFYAGMRDYAARYRDGTALSADFAAVMSRAAGQDLAWYFLQALTQPGYPELAVRWAQAGDSLTLTVHQTQRAEWGLYRMPGLEFLIDGQLLRADVEGRETVVSFHGFTVAPEGVQVDPNGWWLLKARTEN
jgi:aminopeptidase N